MKKLPKRFLLFFIAPFVYLFAACPVFALSQVGLPSSLCSGKYYQCDSETQKRWSLFQSSVGINTDNSNSLTIGSCSINGESDSDTYVLACFITSN